YPAHGPDVRSHALLELKTFLNRTVLVADEASAETGQVQGPRTLNGEEARVNIVEESRRRCIRLNQRHARQRCQRASEIKQSLVHPHHQLPLLREHLGQDWSPEEGAA